MATEWTNIIGQPIDTDVITGVSYDNSGNIYLCGNTYSSGFNINGNSFGKTTNNQNAYVAKLNSSGIFDWGRLYASSSQLEYSMYNHEWTTRTSGSNNDWRSVVWSPELGLFVAVGGTGTANRVMTSPDGINWTARTLADIDDQLWISVTWSPELGLFAAVSFFNNKVITSSDGINWTVLTPTAISNWTSIKWSSELGIFVAVGTFDDRVMTSTDGITWVAGSIAGAINLWRSVCWSAELGLFVAVSNSLGSTNQIMTSPDGNNWTIRTSAAINAWNNVTWSPELGIFVAIADSGTGNRVMTSSNGINWTIRTSAADNNWRSIVWSPELHIFVVVASSGLNNRIMTSPDGITWTLRTSPADNAWVNVCWSLELGIFVAVAATGTNNRVMTSTAVLEQTLGKSIKTHTNGTITVLGTTNYSGFTISGTSFTKNTNSSDIFVIQYDSSGNIVWSTLIGGLGNEFAASALTYDSSGNVYVGGATNSSGFEIQNSRLSYNISGTSIVKQDKLQNAFIAKFNTSGILDWGHLIGDNRSGFTRPIYALACDASNNVYATGATTVSGLNSSGIFFDKSFGDTSAYLVKYNASGIIQFGYIFGSGEGIIQTNNIEVDKITNDIYFGGFVENGSGKTIPNTSINLQSSNTTGIVWKTNNSGEPYWGFAYNPGPSDISGISSSYVGALKLRNNRVYVTGSIAISGYTISGTNIINNYGRETGFVARYTTSSGIADWGEIYGTAGKQRINAIDFYKNAFVIGGETTVSGFVLPEIEYNKNNSSDGISVLKINSSGHILNSFIIDSASTDRGDDITRDTSNNIYILAKTDSSGFSIPGTNIVKDTNTFDSFFLKYNTSGTALLGSLIPGSTSGTGIRVDSVQNICIIGLTTLSGFTISGYSFGKTNTSVDSYITKFNPSGILEWGVLIGGEGNSENLISSIDIDNANNIYVVGRTTTSGLTLHSTSGYDRSIDVGKTNDIQMHYAAKYNTSGELQWGSLLGSVSGTSGAVSPNSMIRTDISQNSVVFATTTVSGFNISGINYSKSNNTTACYLIKLNISGIGTLGTLIDGNATEQLGSDNILDINQTDSSIYVTGQTNTSGFSFRTTESLLGRGRYVRVERTASTSTNVINLNEIEAYDQNASKFNAISANASSILSPTANYSPSFLIDGILTNTTDASGYFHSTEDFTGPGTQWCEIDLGDDEDIYAIAIYNRSDCCQERAQGLSAFIRNNSGEITYTSSEISTTQSTYFYGFNTYNSEKIGTSFDTFVLKLNTNLALQWGNLIAGAEGPYSYRVNSSGDSFLIGRTNISGFNVSGYSLVKYDNTLQTYYMKLNNSGSIIHSQLYYNVQYDGGAVIENNDELYTIGVTSTSGFNPYMEYYNSDGFVQNFQLDVPDSIADLIAYDGDTAIRLAWTPPIETGGYDLSFYEIDTFITSTNAFVSRTIALHVNPAGNPMMSQTGIVSGLTNDINYTFRVRAFNANDEASSIISQTKTPIAIITSQAVINFNINANSLADYFIYGGGQSLTYLDNLLDIRAAIKNNTTLTVGQKADAVASYVSVLQTKYASQSLTIPNTDSSSLNELKNTLNAVSTSYDATKNVIVTLPNFNQMYAGYPMATVDITKPDADQYFHFEVPDGHALKLITNTTAYKTLLYSYATSTFTLLDSFNSPSDPLGSVYSVNSYIRIGSIAIQLYGIGSGTFGQSEGGGGIGDPYIRTVKGVEYKLPIMNGAIRYYQGMVEGKQLTINAQLRKLNNTELFDSNLRGWMNHSSKAPSGDLDAQWKSTFAEKEMNFFEKIYMEYDGNHLLVNIWDGKLRIESYVGKIPTSSSKTNYIMNECSSIYKNIQSTANIQFKFGPAILYVSLYDWPLVRNAIYLQAPAMRNGNGVIINALSKYSMTLSDIRSIKAVPTIDAVRFNEVVEYFNDESGYRRKKIMVAC